MEYPQLGAAVTVTDGQHSYRAVVTSCTETLLTVAAPDSDVCAAFRLRPNGKWVRSGDPDTGKVIAVPVVSQKTEVSQQIGELP
ncbi:hypothetical protein [Mycobacteroides abscessus]|uniref:hypothetical protein n=1 Tax=Mycobacteroides abscessus TaxID=36809 RepID=UPI000C2669BC|nr:hypothetical protein [Mycobacteroides abscessus]